MFENIKNIFKKNKRKELLKSSSKDTAKERLHLVLMQDRANVSADFLDLMRQEIIEVIKKYIDIDEEAMDVRLGSETNEDGTQGAPALYANIPIINIKDETRKLSKTNQEKKIATNIIPHEKEEKIIEETKETVIENENAEEKEEVKEPKELKDEKETPEKSEKVSEKSKENKNTDENEIPKNEKNKIKKEVEKKDEN